MMRRGALALALVGGALAALSCGDDDGGTDPMPVPPPDPTGLTATALSDSTVALAWTDAADDEEGFRVYRGLAADAIDDQVAELAADAESFEDGGLADSVTYHYRVSAFNGAGESGGSDPAAVTTPARLYFPPDFRDTYTLVRDCRFSSSHPLNIQVFVSPDGAEEYLNGNYPLEEGTVCVKTISQSISECDPVAQFVAMRKGRPGIAPESGDWLWQAVSPTFDVDSTGMLASCAEVGCHASCQVTDWTCTEP